MSLVFALPITIIALFESQIAHSRSRMLRTYFSAPDPEDEDDPKIENPSTEGEGEISRVKFDEIVKVFPKWVSLALARIQYSARDHIMRSLRYRPIGPVVDCLAQKLTG